MPSLGGFFVGGFTNPVFGPTGALTTTGVVRDWTMINAAVNLIWSPVRDLDIGVEVSYDRIKLSGAPVSDLNKCAGLAVIPAGVIAPVAAVLRPARSRRRARTSGALVCASNATSDRPADRLRKAPASAGAFSLGVA